MAAVFAIALIQRLVTVLHYRSHIDKPVFPFIDYLKLLLFISELLQICRLLRCDRHKFLE